MSHCERHQSALSEAALAGRAAEAAVTGHASGCRECGTHLRVLERLDAELARSTPAISPALVER